MREHKFRAWVKEEKRMYQVAKIDFDNQEVYLKYEHSATYFVCPFEEIILMEYTGLKDKNGVEIYEGDMFHLGDENILHIVEYTDTAFRGRQKGNKSLVGLSYWCDKLEIIGNIHDTEVQQ